MIDPETTVPTRIVVSADPPNPKEARSAFRSLAAFGSVLGLLTALNTTSGLTVSLIGLLFAFAGASVLSWFKPEVLVDHRAAMIRYIGAVSTGLLIGLFLGMALRFVDEGFIQPWYAEKRDKPSAELKEEFKKIREQFEAIKSKNATGEEWKRAEKMLERVEDLLEKRGSIANGGASPGGRLVFSVQAGLPANAAAEAIQRELNRDKDRTLGDPKKLSEKDREYLESLRQALLKKDPQNHVTPVVVQRVRDLISGGQLSTEAQDAITGALTW